MTISTRQLSTTCLDEFKKTEGVDLSTDKMAMQRLKEAAEKSKIELSTTTTSNINLPFITADATGPKHMDITLTKAKFDELTADLVARTLTCIRNAMNDAGLNASQIDEMSFLSAVLQEFLLYKRLLRKKWAKSLIRVSTLTNVLQ